MLNQDQSRAYRKDEGARGDVLLDLLAALALELHPGRHPRRLLDLDSSLERDSGLDCLARLELALRLERQFGVLLAEAALMESETPAELLAAIDATGPQQHARHLDRAATPRATSAPAAAKTLVDVLEFHVERHGDRAHIHSLGADEEAEPVTYGELWQSAQSVAASLRDHGIENGATIATMLPTGASFFSVFFGCLLAGGVPVPICPPMRRAQIEEHLQRQAGILRNADASRLITTTKASDTLVQRSTVEAMSPAAIASMTAHCPENAVIRPNDRMSGPRHSIGQKRLDQMRGPCINPHQKWINQRCAYRRHKVTPLIDLNVRQAASIYHLPHDAKKG